MNKYILAFDQGTTSSRAIIFDKSGAIVSIAQKEFTQFFPKPGWVEHNPLEIWSSQIGIATEAITQARLKSSDIAAIGITNQRETAVVWDRKTGKPIYNAIVWQDRRTADFCDQLKRDNKENLVREKTGLVIDSYFSGTKVNWILNHVEGAREKAEKGELAFGTIDSWLIWNLTNGKIHATDVTNASRTMLFNINTLEWDNELLDMLDIPRSMLPEVKESSEIFGNTTTTLFPTPIPIGGVAGDQHAALFGQICTSQGMVKNTYGTGCFMLMNIGDKPIISKNNLLTTVAWKINGKVQYALEGSIFIAGAIVQWLRDQIGLIQSSADIEALATSVDNNDGVYFVPAFTGLGAPYWNPHARGTLLGMTRGTKDAHIARAALESIVYQTMEVLKAMEEDSQIDIKELRVDGGASVNDFLMQFQSDILSKKVVRPQLTETTAMGAAYLAGLAVSFWKDMDEIANQWKIDKYFEPQLNTNIVSEYIKGWERAVKASIVWANDHK